MEEVLQQNPGFKYIVESNNVLHQGVVSEDNYVQSLSFTELSLFLCCPVTSSEIERSFSRYGNVLTDKRQNTLFENLKQHMIVQCYGEYK